MRFIKVVAIHSRMHEYFLHMGILFDLTILLEHRDATTVGFSRRQLDVRCLWVPYRGARHLYQMDTYAVSLEAPRCNSVFRMVMKICKVKQAGVVRSIFHVRNFAFTLCWRERTPRPDNNLASCRARPIFPFFDHRNGGGRVDFILQRQRVYADPERGGVLFGETSANSPAM